MAWEREREAKIQAHMAEPVMVSLSCAICGAPSARVELVAPGHLPVEWEQWPGTVQASILREREPGQWYLLVRGIATYNGYGNTIDAARAGRIARARIARAVCVSLDKAGVASISTKISSALLQ